MGLSISKTGCQLGGKLNPRNEFHGDDEVGACDFTVSGIMLPGDEVDELCGAGTYHRLYDLSGPLPEPAAFTKMAGALWLEGKFEKSRVTLYLSGATEANPPGEDEVEPEAMKLGGVTFAKVVLRANTGGLTALELQVQANPEPQQLALLYLNMGKGASCSLRFGRTELSAAAKTPELPLEHQPQPVGEAPLDQVH